ncbi:hypothetical protein, partial [Stenotrophomonas maltophilia]|uniref:hypothetical protein n=1 Tax=Stenotrophomonas maltophilia TaxID=40324 RepID=UPI0019549B52
MRIAKGPAKAGPFVCRPGGAGSVESTVGRLSRAARDVRDLDEGQSTNRPDETRLVESTVGRLWRAARDVRDLDEG